MTVKASSGLIRTVSDKQCGNLPNSSEEAEIRENNQVDVSGHMGIWFSIRFFSFLLYRNCKRLREFEEIEISSQAVEVFRTVEDSAQRCWTERTNKVHRKGLTA